MLKIIAVMATALFATACNMGCDAWACIDKIIITLDKPVESSYKLELLVSGELIDSVTVHCPSSDPCGTEPFPIQRSVGTPLVVRVTTASGSKDTEFTSINWIKKREDNCHTCRSTIITALAP